MPEYPVAAMSDLIKTKSAATIFSVIRRVCAF
jgi:hypothetical protein